MILGIVHMKLLARMHVWWPNIEVDITAHCKDCMACAETGPNQPDNMSARPVPDHPWAMAVHSHCLRRSVPRFVVCRGRCAFEMVTRSEIKQVLDI